MKNHLLVAAFALALLPPGLSAGGADRELGVYEYVVDPVEAPFDVAVTALQEGLAARGWRVLAGVPCGVPAGCPFRAVVVAAVNPPYARQLMAANPRTAPFAVVDRVNVFEDEKGIHLAVVNVESVNRTVLMDDARHEDLARSHLDALRELLGAVVPGRQVHREYGEQRSRGHIGKTMGVMAGGPFAQKLNDEAVVGGGDWQGVAARLRQGLSAPGGKWGMHLVYELELPEHETVVFGTTGSPMDSRSFSIVQAGADGARRSFRCPGLAHAAAYPLEVVVAREGPSVRVRTVDAMYRMKLYFEDAGKWAFMKNMGMPGSIHDELAAQIKSALGRP
jgi:hypothetical protein